MGLTDIYCASDFHTYSSVANAVDGISLDGEDNGFTAARGLMCTEDSTIVVVNRYGQNRTVKASKNVFEPIQFTAIVASGSTLGSGGFIKVYV